MVYGTHRRPVRQVHRARPAKATGERTGDQMQEEYKKEYIDFINQLMARMKMDSIKRMLEAALKETE